jgi:DNA repair exonuclease SbcCD ATPase subunit
MEYTIANMQRIASASSDFHSSESIDDLIKEINQITSQMDQMEKELNEITEKGKINDQHRMMLSQVQHIDIIDKTKQKQKLETLQKQLTDAENQYAMLQTDYSNKIQLFRTLQTELKILQDAYMQYQTTENEIQKHLENDKKYKIIAEATSSTKGKPVIAIRDKVNDAMIMTNRLLDVMYDGEIELLEPIIDETSFTLPFRCGTNQSNDIRYGSQSESTLLSLALSLSLASSLTEYKIPLIDEIDAYLDAHMRDSFLLMLQEIMVTLGMEQMFLISHSILPDQYEHIVSSINLSEEIDKLKESV